MASFPGCSLTLTKNENGTRESLGMTLGEIVWTRATWYQCSLHQDAVSVDQLVGTLRQEAMSTDVGDLWRVMDRVVFIDSTWQQTHGILKVSYT